MSNAPKIITSRSNSLLKELQTLSSSARERRQQNRTLLDGAHLIQAALDANIELLQLVISDSGLQHQEIEALQRGCTNVPCIHLSDTLFKQISPVDTPSGILAIIAIPAAQHLEKKQSIIVLEGVQDNGNLGTLLRTAAAAGIRQVLLSQGCAQAWSPRVLRAGMGGHFQLNIVEQQGLDEIAAQLKPFCGPILATALAADAQPLYAIDLHGPVAWLFGAEGQGLSPEMRALANTYVIIPMPGKVESLNVAAAAAICLFEQVRQNRD